VGRQIGYADALKILGAGDSKLLAAIDKLLGGAIMGAAVKTGQLELLVLLHARDELLRQSEGLLSGFSQRVRGARGKNRTDLLVAAHAVVAVNAYFQAMRNLDVPVDLTRLELTKADQLAMAGAPHEIRSRKLADVLIDTPLPRPAPHRPYEQTVRDMKIWYGTMSQRLVDFVKGLVIWDELNETQQDRFCEALLKDLPGQAAAQYEESFRQLATESSEFHMWIYLTDSAASRAQIAKIGGDLEIGLAGLQRLLENLAVGHSSSEWPDKLATAYRAQLGRPVVETSPDEAHAGLAIPSLVDAYVNPRFRVAEYLPGARPAEESWWQNAVICDDVQWFLAGYLTSPVAEEVPLLILGQPGSGKSLLTKVLAARLPPEDYLPVRVELRHVAADAPLQDQIETALRNATGERMEWPELARAATDALPVVLLDGFDELLQATGMSRSDYLELVREFQRREADQGRRVAVIVTSRTVVADRLRLPEGTVVAKLEPFDDDQVERWLTVWNGTNSAYLASSQLRPLTARTVLAHRDLAEQPLLLLMLALYDADGNALQQHSDHLARADLYERLLSKFAIRELEKHQPGLDEPARVQLVARELKQLSVVAFAMFNRGKKAVTGDELDADLASLLPQDYRQREVSGQFSRRLTQAQLAVGRFFFIHRSQALVDEARLNEYEFLHATFGEYLVARLVFHTLDRIVKVSAADDQGSALGSGTGPDDDDLWDLLSFTPLTDGSQAVGFLAELIQQLEGGRLDAFRHILEVLFRNSLRPRPKGYGGYAPRRLDVPTRHAAYSANLLVLNVLAACGPLSTEALLTTEDQAVGEWRRFALLWRSQLDPAGWDGLVNAFTVTRNRAAPQLEIHPSMAINVTKPLESFRTLDWLTLQSQANKATSVDVVNLGISASKVATQAAFLCSPDLDLLVHALQPLLRVKGQGFSQLLTGPDGTTRSLLHAVVERFLDPSATEGAANALLQLAGLIDKTESPQEHFMIEPKWSSPYTSFKAGERWRRLLERSPTDRLPSTLVIVTPKNTDALNEMLMFYISEYSGKTDALTSLSGLAGLKDALELIDPIQLAEAQPLLIAGILKIAREDNYFEWAQKRGLALLASLPDDKLSVLSADDLEFILASAVANPAHANVIQLIRDRYKAAVVPPSE
jgi:hypothetical protein